MGRMEREQMKDKARTLLKSYKSDKSLRLKVSLAIGLVISFAFSFFEAVCGLIYHSWWFGTQSCYYCILALLRFFLIHYYWKSERNLEKEYRKAMQCGIMLLILTLPLIGKSILITHEDVARTYPGSLIYAVALYAFYAIISAGINLRRFLKQSSPVLLSCKILSFATALVSIYSLQSTMLVTFGDDALFTLRMNAITGSAVCLIIFILSLLMIFISVKKARALP